MMKTTTCLSALLILGAGSFALAQDAAKEKSGAVEMRLKFEPGKSYVTETNMSQKVTMMMGGQEFKTDMTMVILKTSEASNHEKGIKVSEKVDRMTMDMNAAGQVMKFDSNNPEGPMAPMMEPVMKSGGTMIYDEKGNLLEVTVPEIPGGEALGMDKETLEQSAREVSELVPNKTVNVGEKWKVASKVPMGSLTKEPVAIEYTLNLAGVENRDGHEVAKVTLDGAMDGGDENLKVKSKKISGVMYFDPAIGQVREMVMEMDLEVGLPEGIPVEEGAPGTMPVQAKVTTLLKEVK